jgi:hypothetical protein
VAPTTGGRIVEHVDAVDRVTLRASTFSSTPSSRAERAADGVYNVDGTLACATGSGASCGALSFDTVAGTFSIVGSVPRLGVGATTLLVGTRASV